PEPVVLAAASLPTPATLATSPAAASSRASLPPHAANDEPIAAALSAGLGRIHAWWNDANSGTAGKVIVLVLVIIMVVANAGWLIPISTFLVFCYLIYYAI